MEYILLGIDALLTTSLYLIYKHKRRIISNIQSAPELILSKLKPSEIPNSTLEYCLVEGNVKADSLELTSQYFPDIKGVLRMLEIIEHGTKWQSNISFDTNRLITRVINDTPFSLTNLSNPVINIKVEQPITAANYLLESLDVTYKMFEPSQGSSFARFLAELTFKESVRGIETTEKMLKSGARLIVLGKLERLAANNGQIQFRISEPTLKGDYSYVITTQSREALVNHLSETTSLLKIVLVIFSMSGLALSGYCIYKSYNRIKHWLRLKKLNQEIEKARRERIEQERRQRRERTNGTVNDLSSSNINCVICLTNPRELVLFDCGHVCLCMDCLGQLPTHNCPICRQSFRDFAPCYLP